MTNETPEKPQPAGPTIDHDPSEAPRARRPKLGFGLTVGLALAALIGIGAAVAVAQGGGWGHGRGGFGPMGGHGIGRMLDEIDASADQETRIWAIIDRTRSELRPMGREFRSTDVEAAALLSAATIDRAAVEKLRADRMAAIDDASRKLVSAMIEAAEVLTPEQRAKLAAEMKERHGGRW
jgi:protein CpxP